MVYTVEIVYGGTRRTRGLRGRDLYVFQKSGFSKIQYLGFEFFYRNANVVFIEKSEFFSEKPLFVTKPYL